MVMVIGHGGNDGVGRMMVGWGTLKDDVMGQMNNNEVKTMVNY